jgi:hypothetical protein
MILKNINRPLLILDRHLLARSSPLESFRELRAQLLNFIDRGCLPDSQVSSIRDTSGSKSKGENQVIVTS